jgi:hypothetical protein
LLLATPLSSRAQDVLDCEQNQGLWKIEALYKGDPSELNVATTALGLAADAPEIYHLNLQQSDVGQVVTRTGCFEINKLYRFVIYQSATVSRRLQEDGMDFLRLTMNGRVIEEKKLQAQESTSFTNIYFVGDSHVCPSDRGFRFMYDIQFDSWPNEITWLFSDYNTGEELFTQTVALKEGATELTQEFAGERLSADYCSTPGPKSFTIFDSAGDGILNGFYQLGVGFRFFAQGGNFLEEETTNFFVGFATPTIAPRPTPRPLGRPTPPPIFITIPTSRPGPPGAIVSPTPAPNSSPSIFPTPFFQVITPAPNIIPSIIQTPILQVVAPTQSLPYKTSFPVSPPSGGDKSLSPALQSSPVSFPDPPVDPTPSPTKKPTPKPTPKPTTNPTPKPTSKPTANTSPPIPCFSGTTTVVTHDRGLVEMRDLKIGDKVAVGDGNYEPIYSFGHFQPNVSSESFVAIATKGGNETLEVSGHHLLFDVRRGAVPAATVQVGDYLVNGRNASEPLLVTSIRSVTVESGLFAPFTPSGKVVVNDGVLASCFVSFQEKSHTLMIMGIGFSYHWLAQLFESAHRLVCFHMGSCPNETYDENGLSEWVSRPLAMAIWLHHLGPGPMSHLLLCVFIVGVSFVHLVEVLFFDGRGIVFCFGLCFLVAKLKTKIYKS